MTTLERQAIYQTRRCKAAPLTTAQSYSLLKELERIKRAKK